METWLLHMETGQQILVDEISKDILFRKFCKIIEIFNFCFVSIYVYLQLIDYLRSLRRKNFNDGFANLFEPVWSTYKYKIAKFLGANFCVFRQIFVEI